MTAVTLSRDGMTNTIGHGHVRPRDDGYKARCGGPAICGVCQSEERRARPRTAGKPPALPTRAAEDCDHCEKLRSGYFGAWPFPCHVHN